LLNVELSKISAWAVKNKIRFNKTKAMLLTRGKKEKKLKYT
jgi:hypothetical protein